MNLSKSIRTIMCVATLIVVSGCAIVPGQIDVAKNTVLVPFEEISASIAATGSSEAPGPNADNKARWGGKIVSVLNKKDMSEIEVVFFPENRFGKPKTGLPSTGRFKAFVEGFVDPLVFEQGRLITVVGEVSNSHSGIIGEQDYTYPTLNAKGYYMWKETTDVNVEIDSFAFSPFGFNSGFHRSFFNPWYDPWLRNRQRTRVRIERYNGHSQGGTVNRNNATRTNQSKNRPARTTQVRDVATSGKRELKKKH
jgi:outer membrane lipoprotein